MTLHLFRAEAEQEARANERATKPGAGGKPEPLPARPVRTITLRTFPRLTAEELAAVFGIPFGYDEITEVHA